MQCVQTLRFSSNSLSKTIVLHLGHLVHRPSGISRFLDLRDTLGFLTKVVLLVAGGGVTAGSAVSRPSVFLVKDVVAMLSSRLTPYYSNSAGKCPDANFSRPGGQQNPGTGAGRGAGCKNIIHQHDAFTVQRFAGAHGKG